MNHLPRNAGPYKKPPATDRRRFHVSQSKYRMPPFAVPATRTHRPPQMPRPAPLAPRPCRSGISLIEILISMGVLTLGLMGVAAMFPVGGHYILTAEVADRGAAIAQAAFSDVVAQGVLNPEGWIVYKPQPGAATPVSPTRTFAGDGADNKFTRLFRRALAQSLADTRSLLPDVAQRQRALAQQFGHAFVIDPLAVASVSPRTGTVDNSDTQLKQARNFPAVAQPTSHRDIPPWDTWTLESSFVSTPYWPIRRVTTRSSVNASTLAIEAALADHLAASADDLALDFPDESDAPATQLWATSLGPSGQPIPAARQWTGDYSWIATVSPTTSAARDALATGGGSHYYNVSVVVFYKRGLDRTTPPTPNDLDIPAASLQRAERMTRARIVSRGVSGGELLLEALPESDTLVPPESPIIYDELKRGRWIMLCGPHPSSTDLEPLFVLNWYRVVAIDGEDTPLQSDGTPFQVTPPSTEPARRLVALRGPQWPWVPANLTDGTALSNNLRVGIFEGAVAVHSRTMRLEGNSAWSIGP